MENVDDEKFRFDDTNIENIIYDYLGIEKTDEYDELVNAVKTLIYKYKDSPSNIQYLYRGNYYDESDFKYEFGSDKTMKYIDNIDGLLVFEIIKDEVKKEKNQNKERER